MSIAEEYLKKAKTPLLRVTLTRFTDDTPSVDGEGDNYYPEVISCDISGGFDQGSSNCTLVIKTPNDLYGNDVRFKPMDRVKIEQGWNKTSTYRVRFFGFIDQVDFTNPPQLQKLECRDILKLAQDNYLIHSNRLVYFKDPVVDELDDEGSPMGGQTPGNRTAKKIISTLLTDSGIPESRQQLDFVDYPASGAIIIGGNAVAVFVYESAMDAANRICDLIGYRLWADSVGQVQCREVRPIAGETSIVTYRSQEETYNGSFTVVTPGNLISIDSKTDDDLRNWVTVYGYEELISTVAGVSEYVPSPPTYRRTEIRSYLLDTQELVTAVAARVYSDLNRLRHTARATIEGDPRLEIGQTITVYDAFATEVSINYILYDYNSRFSAGEWLMDLSLVGGAGSEVPGSSPIGNISPVALFDHEKEIEFLPVDDNVITEVFVDATPSYDPDGSIEDLSYLWVCSGYDNVTTVKNSYTVSGDVTSLSISLTVTDNGTPPLSNTLVRTVSLVVGEQLQWKTIFVASGDVVWTTDTGGASWIDQKIY